MLALRSLRNNLHFFPAIQIRALRTKPRSIPNYIRAWNPTSQKPLLASVTSPVDSTETQNAHDASLRMQPSGSPTNRSDKSLEAAAKRLSISQRHAHRRLGYFLQLAIDNPDVVVSGSVRSSVWRAYTLAKAIDPRLRLRLPDSVWDILWTTQYHQSRNHRTRRAHLEQLYRDMYAAGKGTTLGQRVLYLSSIYLKGHHEQMIEAVQAWELEDAALLRERYTFTPGHLELGAKLHAAVGNPDRARDIMDELFRLYPNWDPLITMHVFRAYTSSPKKSHHEKARELYMLTRSNHKQSLSRDDYDSWLLGFISAQHLAFAKQVFRDMVRDGHLAEDNTDIAVHTVLVRLHWLYRLGTDISKMTSIVLDAIAVLPKAYHGSIFGEWFRSAVVRNTPDVALEMVELMQQRGFAPKTLHFNYLLRALFRDYYGPNVLKAENIGWRMIEQTRKSSNYSPETITTHQDILRNLETFDHARSDEMSSFPAANATTFALLMRHHSRNSQWEHVDYIWRQVNNLGIEMNATMMNLLIDKHCRQGAYLEAWKVYTNLTQPLDGSVGVFPNGRTLRLLWICVRMSLGDHSTRETPGMPTPRELLKETCLWWSDVHQRADALSFRKGLGSKDGSAILPLIMHCFSYTQDLPGSLIALHFLRRKLGIFPTEKAAEILQRQMAWVGADVDISTSGERIVHSHSSRKNTERVAQIYEVLRERRVERLNLTTEEEQARLTKEEIADFGLNLLSEFVRVILKRSYPPEIVEAMIYAAKHVVGLPDIETGDMDAFEVA